MTLEELAGVLRETAARAEESLAREVVTEMARTYLAILKTRTPVRSGMLRDSEYPDFIAGNGEHATAAVSPHTVYAQFREDGGTITVKRAKVLTDGVSFFGRSVTQEGSHYVERSHNAALAPCHAAAQEITDRYFLAAGL